ncbi:aldose 1-epimerase-like, partial [Olea europaea subsp. europaea]
MKVEALNRAIPVNLAQHIYWNLGCHNSGTIIYDELQIFTTYITPVKCKQKHPHCVKDIQHVVGCLETQGFPDVVNIPNFPS